MWLAVRLWWLQPNSVSHTNADHNNVSSEAEINHFIMLSINDHDYNGMCLQCNNNVEIWYYALDIIYGSVTDGLGLFLCVVNSGTNTSISLHATVRYVR